MSDFAELAVLQVHRGDPEESVMTGEMVEFLMAYKFQLITGVIGGGVIMWAVTHWIAQPGGTVAMFWGACEVPEGKARGLR